MMNIIRINSRISLLTPKQGTLKPLFIFSSSFHSSIHHPLPLQNCKYGFDDINNLEDAVHLFHTMLQTRPMPFVQDYNKLLNIIVKMEHYSHVILLFKKLSLFDCPINEYTMSTVINCYCNLKEVDSGFAVLAYFIKRGYDPNIVSINCLIQGLFLKGNVAEAVFLFKKLIRDKLCEVTVYTISIVSNGLCKSGNVVYALELLQMLKHQEYELNVVVYNTVVDGLCKARRVEEAMALLLEMIDRDILPDVVTYTCFIHGLCNNHKLGFARSLFEELPSKMVYPNVITYNVMLQGLCRAALFQDAKEMLDKMEQLGCHPNSVTYNIIIQNCLHHRYNSDSIDLLKLIIGRAFQLDAPSFFLLLRQMQVIRQMHGIYDDDVVTHLIRKLISSDARHQMQDRNGVFIIQSLTQKLASSATGHIKE